MTTTPRTKRPTAQETAASFTRQRIALRSWLLGRSWFDAVRAMDYAERFHTGLRKDGITPEFSHQVQIALYLTTLTPHLRHPQETITVALLHDICEDYDVEFADILARFGSLVADSTRAMTKQHKGIRRDPHEVAAEQAADVVASVVKGADRIHNQSTLLGVFTPDKISEYLDETRVHILPMLKTARRVFPEQDGAYQNVRTILVSQALMLETVAA